MRHTPVGVPPPITHTRFFSCRKKVAEHQRAERERAAAAREAERLRSEVAEAKQRKAELQRLVRLRGCLYFWQVYRNFDRFFRMLNQMMKEMANHSGINDRGVGGGFPWFASYRRFSMFLNRLVRVCALPESK